MRLGIMQPYFFPYIGYFELIAGTDKWIVFDVVQFNQKSWMSRNRILHPEEGWQYISIPVKKSPHGTPIHKIRVKDKDAALTRLHGQLDHYKRHASYFSDVLDVVNSAFSINSDRLVDLNVKALASVCDYLGICFDYSLCSEMDLDLGMIEHPGQWALEICKQMGANEYLNPPGGKDIFRQSEWDAAGITLSFNDMPDFTYRCDPYGFIENLSILDVLMWNDPSIIAKALQPRSVY
jgi:hypothetical protein